MEGDRKPILKYVPYPVTALAYALVITVAGCFFIYGAKLISALPDNLDIPWILVFAAAFFIILVRNRIRAMRQDQKPKLS
jgi:hypothetical protein